MVILPLERLKNDQGKHWGNWRILIKILDLHGRFWFLDFLSLSFFSVLFFRKKGPIEWEFKKYFLRVLAWLRLSLMMWRYDMMDARFSTLSSYWIGKCLCLRPLWRVALGLMVERYNWFGPSFPLSVRLFPCCKSSVLCHANTAGFFGFIFFLSRGYLAKN